MTPQLSSVERDRSEFDGEGDATIGPNARLIQPELEWFSPPLCESVPIIPNSQVILARWAMPESPYPVELSSCGGGDFHTLTAFLRTTRGRWSFGRRLFFEGRVPWNSLWIKEPYQPAHAIYYERSTSFRVYLPQALIAECYESTFGRPPGAGLVLLKTTRIGDRILSHLVQMLRELDDRVCPINPLFLDGVSLALASRLVELGTKNTAFQSCRKETSALAKWRLNRSIDYIEANLSRPIYLSQLSDAVGLSRMHFAAQFRAATGYTPSRYIQRCKIARAQALLRNPSMSIVDTALTLGFSTQAHFTVVFKSIVGHTPARWRRHLR
jgi:AraC family transcriptional regulator